MVIAGRRLELSNYHLIDNFRIKVGPCAYEVVDYVSEIEIVMLIEDVLHIRVVHAARKFDVVGSVFLVIQSR